MRSSSAHELMNDLREERKSIDTIDTIDTVVEYGTLQNSTTPESREFGIYSLLAVLEFSTLLGEPAVSRSSTAIYRCM